MLVNRAKGDTIKRTVGARKDPFPACNFLVEIDAILAGGFAEVSGLTIKTEIQTKKVGGYLQEYKYVSGIKYNDLTLKHGITVLDSLWAWYDDVLNGSIDRKNGSIYLLNQGRAVVMGWFFFEALPIEWNGPTFNAANNTVAFETLVLSHRGLVKFL